MLITDDRICQAVTIFFFSRDSPMGQPEATYQMPDHAWLWNQKFNVVWKLLVEP